MQEDREKTVGKAEEADRVAQALDGFVEAHEAGKTLDPDEFCRDHPGIEGSLRKAIDNYLYAAGGIGEAPSSVPERIGAYEILSIIGEGGMGIVYLAEQKNPVRRRVAVKLIKPGMDSKAIISRFESERQALAMMDHTHIAQVFDAGTSEDGRPYFVMEYIAGTPITDYCDGHDVSLEERLRLFQKTCDAIQHAHQKAIIHRDLKPSNILVTEQDGEPIPKVIDFGLAKAIGPQLTERSLFTEQGMLVGTPEYMSPEQADSECSDIDTRSDIYSLGVILYRLLTGSLPVDISELRRMANLAALGAIRRKICEDEPQRPSLRSRRLRGDLDWITMKALEKDRTRRYATPSDLAADIERHLSHEPVLAGPPSTAYRLRKFVKKNLGAVLSLAAIFLLTVTAGLILAVFYVRTEASLDEVLRLSDVKRLQELLDEADGLWPAYPDRTEELEKWLVRADQLLANLEVHRSSLAALRELAVETPESGSSPEPTRWRFSDAETQWRHDVLVELVTDLVTFSDPDPKVGAMASVDERLEFSRTVARKTTEKYDVEWEEAIASIASPEECPAYDGFQLDPHIGLVPIGRDPSSGLWEFADIQTGEIPERDESGNLLLDRETGLVFVLIPGGTFTMGAQNQDENAPNYDPHAQKNEGPVHAVTVQPFFFSKFEMTQGQWERFARDNPSYYKSGGLIKDTGLHPVEQVSWEDCDRILSRLGLLLPTEEQWEYAARAGTTTTWWTGSDRGSLIGAANLADRAAKGIGATWPAIRDWPELDDGFGVHAPVGTYRANGFGLHEIHGNVWEWCLGDIMEYDLAAAEDGSARLRPDTETRVRRGGSYYSNARNARSALRLSNAPAFRLNALGCRPVRRATTSSSD